MKIWFSRVASSAWTTLKYKNGCHFQVGYFSMSSFSRINLWSEAQINDRKHLNISHSQKNKSICFTVPWHFLRDVEGCMQPYHMKTYQVLRPVYWLGLLCLLACFLPLCVLRRFGLSISLTHMYAHLSWWEELKEYARSCTSAVIAT